MQDAAHTNQVLLIPCSGIGKVHGLISREAVYKATDTLGPDGADTVCLALLVTGDAVAPSETGEAARDEGFLEPRTVKAAPQVRDAVLDLLVGHIDQAPALVGNQGNEIDAARAAPTATSGSN